MGKLKAEGYITVGKDGGIRFTESGRAVAEKIYERHTILTEYLIGIGVDPESAREDACRIEHVISDASFDVIKGLVNGK